MPVLSASSADGAATQREWPCLPCLPACMRACIDTNPQDPKNSCCRRGRSRAEVAAGMWAKEEGEFVESAVVDLGARMGRQQQPCYRTQLNAYTGPVAPASTAFSSAAGGTVCSGAQAGAATTAAAPRSSSPIPCARCRAHAMRWRYSATNPLRRPRTACRAHLAMRAWNAPPSVSAAKGTNSSAGGWSAYLRRFACSASFAAAPGLAPGAVMVTSNNQG
eukprot:jgi/Chlat1/5362/Chrsp35S05285